MRLSNPDQPLFLNYRGRGDQPDAAFAAAAAGPLWPVLSTLPGLFCWLLFASAAMPRELPIVERLAGAFGAQATNTVVLVAWAVAMGTSVTALVVFGRRQQLWYTTICLAIHLAGLLFSLLLLGGLAVLLIA